MSNPDQHLIPVPAFLGGEETHTQFSALNPFQLRTFLDLHRYYDEFLRMNKLREFLFRKPSEADLEETTSLLRRSIDRNHTAYDIEEKTAPIIAFTIAGESVFDASTIKQLRKLMELSVRGLMDIDHKTFEFIFKYFEKYSLNLRLYDQPEWIGSRDQRFISNRSEFSMLRDNLSGSHLYVIDFPNADQFSEINWHAFINQVKSRAEKVARELRV